MCVFTFFRGVCFTNNLPELEDSIIDESKVELKLEQTTLSESNNKSLIQTIVLIITIVII